MCLTMFNQALQMVDRGPNVFSILIANALERIVKPHKWLLVLLDERDWYKFQKL